MKKFLYLLLFTPLLFSCSTEDNVNQNIYVSLGTVANPNNSTSFYFTLDDSTKMKVVKSDLSNYSPNDGQRIIAYYSLLNEAAANAGNDYDIRLNNVYEVLTKGIFKLTPESADSIGNDYIHIQSIWIGSDYLNVEFSYPGYDKTHFINLISDSTKTYTDGKIHLEFRHNSNGDYPSYTRMDIVSFNLKSLQANATDSVQLVIHTKEYDYGDKTYNRTYKFGSQPETAKGQQVTLHSFSHDALFK